jgi:hypothetical protein
VPNRNDLFVAVGHFDATAVLRITAYSLCQLTV